MPLVGGSHRCATGTILVLGVATCGLGSKVSRTAMKPFAILGSLALVLTVLALWALSTVRHAAHLPARPVAT